MTNIQVIWLGCQVLTQACRDISTAGLILGTFCNLDVVEAINDVVEGTANQCDIGNIKTGTKSIDAKFHEKLENLSLFRKEKKFEAIEWFRNQGHNGGSLRLVVEDSGIHGFINVSQVQYENIPKKADSDSFMTIITNESYAASKPMHISWTELKDGKGLGVWCRPSINSGELKQNSRLPLPKPLVITRAR